MTDNRLSAGTDTPPPGDWYDGYREGFRDAKKINETFGVAQAATPSMREALEKMVAMYEGEYDADVPFKRPDWLIAALSSDVAQPSRDAVIEECAAVCDKHASWSEQKIERNPSSNASQIFATISNAANDLAAMIRDLKASALTSLSSHHGATHDI